jgi:hypothetical protein
MARWIPDGSGLPLFTLATFGRTSETCRTTAGRTCGRGTAPSGIPMQVSEASLDGNLQLGIEPGTRGFRRPILLVAADIADRLDDEQLDAIISHELAPRLPITLSYTSDDRPGAANPGPSLFTALQEQLGLRLESQKVRMDLIVIDSAEKPTQD